MRGEYAVPASDPLMPRELPPRARRIQDGGRRAIIHDGTTSACAENTSITGSIKKISENYLRVRGEYSSLKVALLALLELPPRARRIQHPQTCFRSAIGTTSACAENTPQAWSHPCVSRNYLRVRGEYSAGTKEYDSNMELPPRARRIRQLFTRGHKGHGTTSACAENTILRR